MPLNFVMVISYTSINLTKGHYLHTHIYGRYSYESYSHSTMRVRGGGPHTFRVLAFDMDARGPTLTLIVP